MFSSKTLLIHMKMRKCRGRRDVDTRADKPGREAQVIRPEGAPASAENGPGVRDHVCGTMIFGGILNCGTSVCEQELVPLERTRNNEEAYAEHLAPPDEPLAACDQLIALLEHALRLEPIHASARDDAIQAPMTHYIAAQLRMRIRRTRKQWARITRVIG